MAENFGSGRFELYNIEILDLEGDRRHDLRTITFRNPDRIEYIYERGEEEEITTERPLKLKGPSDTCEPYDSVCVIFGEPEMSMWTWSLSYYEACKRGNVNQPVQEYVNDTFTDSCALIYYNFMLDAVDAHLKFTCEFERDDCKNEDLVIQILEGEIYATSDGLDYTKRMIRSFSPTEEKEKKLYHSGDTILLDRSRFAQPVCQTFHVTVDLKYILVNGSSPVPRTTSTISLTHIVSVPKSPMVATLEFVDPHALNAKLKLDITWSDDLYAREEAIFLNTYNTYKHLCLLPSTKKVNKIEEFTGEK